MNENIDLTKILKDCPKGTEFYSTLHGKVYFDRILKEKYPITFTFIKERGCEEICSFSSEGKYLYYLSLILCQMVSMS